MTWAKEEKYRAFRNCEPGILAIYADDLTEQWLEICRIRCIAAMDIEVARLYERDGIPIIPARPSMPDNGGG